MRCMGVPSSEFAKKGGMSDPTNYYSLNHLKDKGISVQLHMFDAKTVSLTEDKTGSIVCEAHVVAYELYHITKLDVLKIEKITNDFCEKCGTINRRKAGE